MCLGVPGQIVNIVDNSQLQAIVDVAGVQRAVNLSCIADGDSDLNDFLGCWVLVHVGFAMSVIDETEAKKTLELLTQLGDMQQELAVLQESET